MVELEPHWYRTTRPLVSWDRIDIEQQGLCDGAAIAFVRDSTDQSSTSALVDIQISHA